MSSHKTHLLPRRRLAGLFVSIIAVAALSATVLADNHNIGFGHTVTPGGQLFLLVIASLLLAAQLAAYLIQIHRAQRLTNRKNDRTTTTVPGTKN